MSASRLRALLSEAQDVRQLARALGQRCLEELDELGSRTARQDPLSAWRKALETAVLGIPLNWWFDPERHISGFAALLEQPTVGAEIVTLANDCPPLADLAVLRAVCRGPLTHFYAHTWATFDLKRGDPIPNPERPTHKAFEQPTPAPHTLDRGTLLEGTSFRLYGGPIHVPVAVRLDFSDRDNLDAATWIGDDKAGRIPDIASVHPHASSGALIIDEVTDTAFFGVRPEPWDEHAVLEMLRSASRAGIAVLPELSIPHPEALDDALRDNPDQFSSLVVAGSAHAAIAEKTTADDYTRVNQVHVYLGGAPLLSHCKVHAFVTTYLGEEYSRVERREDLSCWEHRITVAAGTRTRLGVVICADLNDNEIPNLLEQVGVNLLLVPALTVSPGAFVSACMQLAGRRQAVAVVVNGSAGWPAGEPPPDQPFMIIAAVPIVDEQAMLVPPPAGGRRAVGLVELCKTGIQIDWL